MGKPISLFSGYSQRENRTTNYCLLALKMLYEENPRYLAEACSTLIGQDMGEHIGVTFRQQERKASSIPDGLIVQRAITIFLETKHFDWFYDEQLESHLSGLDDELAGLKILIALGNFESTEKFRFDHIRTLCREKYASTITFAAVTFEEFINAVSLPSLPKTLADRLLDLRAYLDEEGLLPSWSQWLDVVNCAGVPEDVLEGNVYICPAAAGAYSHSRSAYFGMYRNKRVEVIASIRAVVEVDSPESGVVKWVNDVPSPVDESALRREAVDLLLRRRPKEIPGRVFLLGPLHQTDFRKDSPGGMIQSKLYFNIAQLGVKSAEELARTLRGMKWSDF